jgi:Outer membrane protein beta-barrel domain
MRRIALLAALVFAIPAAADAQARLMVGGGLTTPQSDFADTNESGMHGRVGLQVGVPVFPVSVRAEGELHRLPETGGDNTTMIVGTLSGVVALGGLGISPYILGGVGKYNINTSTAEATASSGIHGGFGVSLGALGFGGYAEIRYVKIDTAGDNSSYIPITVGFRF